MQRNIHAKKKHAKNIENLSEKEKDKRWEKV